jgi:type IV pilus assembly protein PilA
MAVAVPSVMSYMNEGKNAKYQTAARTVLIDAQTQYAKGVADGADGSSAVNKATSYIEHKTYTGSITVSDVTITVDGGSDAAEKDVTKVKCTITIDGNDKNVTIDANKKVTVS